jgi:hypothetical protein
MVLQFPFVMHAQHCDGANDPDAADEASLDKPV